MRKPYELLRVENSVNLPHSVEVGRNGRIYMVVIDPNFAGERSVGFVSDIGFYSPPTWSAWRPDGSFLGEYPTRKSAIADLIAFVK